MSGTSGCRRRWRAAIALLGLAACASASAAEVTYQIDPQHTFPSFEADHFGGLSVWRGKFNATRGTVLLDKTAGSGSVDITVDAASIDYGLDEMNTMAKSDKLFDVAKYPEAVYRGKFATFVDGKPTKVTGQLTLHGVTRPLELSIASFKCVPHPMLKREVCGADASASFDRGAFGMDAGKEYGFDMAVRLRIQVEAVAAAQAK